MFLAKHLNVVVQMLLIFSRAIYKQINTVNDDAMLKCKIGYKHSQEVLHKPQLNANLFPYKHSKRLSNISTYASSA